MLYSRHDIIDKDGKCVENHSVCFSHLFSLKNLKKIKKVKIYLLKEKVSFLNNHCSFGKKRMETFINEINDAFSIKIKVENKSNLNIINSEKYNSKACKSKIKNISLTIDVEDLVLKRGVHSIQLLTVILTLVRYLYEKTPHTILKRTFLLKTKNKSDAFWDLFIKAHYDLIGTTNNHTIFSGLNSSYPKIRKETVEEYCKITEEAESGVGVFFSSIERISKIKDTI